ncbi:MAG TPA: ABC transporter substrate-binding protein [Gaiellaceae bacterium]
MGAGDAPVRTFLIADIRGYTRYTQEHGDEAAARLASAFAEIVGDTVGAHDGSLIELRGDEALVVFVSARQALRAAVEVQRRCRATDEGGPVLPLGVGIGLDSGEAVPLEGGGYRGGALNLAARLCSVARPGEILASAGVVHLAQHVEGLRFVARRPERLKGIAERVRAVEIVPEEPLPALPKPPTARRRSLGRLGVAGIVVAVAAAATAALAIVLTRSADGGTLAANAAGLLESNGRIVAQVPVAGRPAGVAVGENAAWVTDSVNGTLLKVDPDTNLVVDRIDVGAGPSGVAVGAGSVWVANSQDGTVSRVNAVSDTVVDTIRVGNGPTSVAYGEGRAWVLNAIDATVSAITPGRVRTTTIRLGQNPTRLAFGLEAVWVTSAEAGVLLRIDPRTNTVVGAIPVGNGPVGVAAGDGSIWVANTPDRTVSRVDPESGTVSKIALPGRPVELALAGAELWASNTLDGTLSIIDVRSGGVRRTLTTSGDPTALAAAADRMWVLALAASPSHRGGTLRVVSQGGDTFDSIDPGAAFRAATWQMLSMVYDGLVAYRRTGGPSGQEVVPDLATALPVVQDGGKTYVFRLRDGVRYSDGTLVKASDVRASLEREFRAGKGLAGALAVLGADRCSQRRCDLSRGIVVDDDARTVTFHLEAPDPDFLFKLALPVGAVVPKGAPAIDVGRRPLPGTGPYRIARFVPDRSLVLTRNPRFREWSADAQPAGYPDRIVYQFGIDPTRATRDVEQGRADIMVDSPPSDRLREIETRFPSQAHPFVEPTIFYLFLNTRIPPFNDRRVRRALNYAVDRAELVRFWGGPQLARPTCQVLPPGIAGYRPYCPYTAAASAAGNWKAPDLGRARDLIEAAGGAHGAVSVHANADDLPRVAVARYFVGVLERLGYKARLQTWPGVQAFYEQTGRPSTRANAGVQGWESDFPRASDFFPSLLTCASYQPDAQVNLNAGGFCDKKLDDKIHRAQLLALTDLAASAALWSSVDREVASASPWVPFLNRAGIDLTSARVGNYQRHQQFAALLDQMWVQ